MVPTLALQEWQTGELDSVTLSARDRRLASELTGVTVQELRNGIRAEAKSWVGVVRFDAFTLQIKPKLSYIDIARMLMVGGGLDRLRRYRAERSYQLDADMTLFDLIAYLLADACTLIVRDGLLNGYVEEDDDLPVMRGRLRVADQVRHRYGQIDRLECHFDDHHADILDNQVLFTALTICRQYARHPQLQRRVRHLEETFAAVCSGLRSNWRDAQAGLVYNRLNERYREAHTLAWIVFEGLNVDDLTALGQTRGFAFLLDMNPLFEAFINAFVRAALAEAPLSVRTQVKTAGRIWDVGRGRSYASLIPDLLIESDTGERLVMDAKYKRYESYDLSNSDIYQTFLYAHVFNDGGDHLPSAMLLYPADGPHQSLTRLQIRDMYGVTRAQLHAYGINIARALDELLGGTGDTMQRMRQRILDLI